VDFVGVRAEEIIPGGFMFLALLGRSSPDAEEESGLGCCAYHLEDLVMTLGVSAVEESYHVKGSDDMWRRQVLTL